MVDPQILSDVIDQAFFLPGPSMRRAMRLQRAQVSIQARDCGLEPYRDLDYTGDRDDQALFPDLELIAEKNLSEVDADSSVNKRPDFRRLDPDATIPPSQRDEKTVLGDDVPCRYQSLPSWPQIDTLVLAWPDVAMEVLYSAPMREVKVRTAKCLREKSGLAASDADPTGSWMNSATYFLSGDSKDWDRDQTRLSKVYVACAGEFAAEMKRRLEVKRVEHIERSRELLERYARELSAAGYVP